MLKFFDKFSKNFGRFVNLYFYIIVSERKWYYGLRSKYFKFKKKALKATNAKRSNKVIKTISSVDKKDLYYVNKDAIEQNKIERIENMQAVIENDHYYKSLILKK